ncbi:hypothetical protein MTO96_026752 [Rhipicephalus appendiculatus]
MDLKSDEANPYAVNKVSANILFGEAGFHEVETLEVHWVVWDNVDKKGLNPSRSLRDKLFVPDDKGQYSQEEQDIFRVRSGAVITVVTMYKPNTNPNKWPDVTPEMGLRFGMGMPAMSVFMVADFPECRDPSAVYLFRLNVMERSVLVFHKGYTRRVCYDYYDHSTTTHGLYFVIDNAKPLRILIETMGYDWQ